MTSQGITRALLDTGACRRLLSTISHSPRGERVLRQLGRHHGIFDSFAEAWTAAAEDRHAGHDHQDSLQYLLELSETLRPSDYAALFWLSRIEGESRIFDFGGSVGNLFYSYRPYLPNADRLRWRVHDLPVFVEHGRRIAVERGVGDVLSFAQTLADTGDANVLLVSGALHYWEHSVAELLQQLDARPEHILVNRSPIHDTAASFITIQRMDRYAVPCMVRNGPALLEEFSRLGYVLVNQWRALELSITLPLFPERSVPHYSGFYFRRERRSVAAA